MELTSEVREASQAIANTAYYSNPFWSDPTDPTREPAAIAAAEALIVWRPKVVQRVMTACLLYLALWVLDIILIVKWFSLPNNGNGGESVGVPSILLFLSLISIAPIGLYKWVMACGRTYAGQVAQVRAESTQRYNQWLAALQRSNPNNHAQIILWHQGQQQIELQQRANALQAWSVYEHMETNRHLREMRDGR